MKATTSYYLFSALLDFGLGVTVTAYAPFLLSLGLSLGQVGLVNAVFWIVVIASELPTGMLADSKSRAWSLKAGALMSSLGALAYVIATDFWSAVLAESLIAIGIAFLSGARQAWIADALEREGQAERKRQVYATEAIVKAMMMLSGGIIGALLALISYQLIFLPYAILGVLSFIFATRYMNSIGEPIDRVTELVALRRSITHLASSKELIWLVVTMIIFGVVVSFNHYWSIYFQPSVGQMGLSGVWAVIYLSLISSGIVVRKLKTPAGKESTSIAMAILLSGIGLFAISMMSGLVAPLAAVVVHEFGRGMFQPLTDSFVQYRVKSSYRATFGSLQSFLGHIGLALTPVVVWFLIEGKPNTIETISIVWHANGLILISGACLMWVIRPKHS
ncbi:MFS transporter [Patescibacteria group bacterium]